MFIDIDYNKKIEELKIQLAKPNKQIIKPITSFFNGSMNLKLGNVSELSFSIPSKIDGVKNPDIDIIKERMYLKIKMNTYSDWYIIDSIVENSDDTDTLDITAFSLPFELGKKRVSGFQTESMNAKEILDEVLSTTIWKSGLIDPMFLVMYRSFDSGDDNNALDCITQIGETFGCLIEFNSENRTVSLKNASTNSQYKGLSVNYGRFLKSLKRSRTTDEMVTRLYVYGSEDLTIHAVNPTGTGYLEDFSYFMFPFERDANKNVLKSSYYMSDALCHAILDQKILINQNAPQIATKSSQIATKETKLITESTKLETRESELDNIQQLLDVANSTGDQATIDQRKTEKTAKELEVANQQVVVDNLETELINLKAELKILQDNISQQANFTQQLKDELNLYVYEASWRDDRYTSEQDLYDEALIKFQEINKPKIVIDIDIENLLNILDEQYYWDKVSLGELVKVKYEEMNIDYMAKIIEINYDFDNDTSSLVIANVKDLLNETEKLVQLLYSNSSASTLVENNKNKWNKVNYVQEQVSSLLTSEWDATKNKIVASVNNSVEIGNRGIIVKNPDTPNNIVIMQSGVIALSKDNGETWKTAISADGVVAQRLIGQVVAGQNLLITNDSGTFTLDKNGATFDVSKFIVRASNGDNVVQDWQDASRFTDDYNDDGKLTAYEKKMLKYDWDYDIAVKHLAILSKVSNYWANNDGDTKAFVITYKAKYNALNNYLFIKDFNGKKLLGVDNLSNTTDISKSEYDTVYSQFYSARVDIEKELDLRSKQIAQNANDLSIQNQNEIVYRVEIISTNGLQFKNSQVSTTLIAKVYRGNTEITNTLPITAFKWKKIKSDGSLDAVWNVANANIGKQVAINPSDVIKKATFQCDIDI